MASLSSVEDQEPWGAAGAQTGLPHSAQLHPQTRQPGSWQGDRVKTSLCPPRFITAVPRTRALTFHGSHYPWPITV